MSIASCLLLLFACLLCVQARRSASRPSLHHLLHELDTRPPWKAVVALVNPISGRRSGVQDWESIESVLREQGVKVDTHVTERSGHASEVLARVAAGRTCASTDSTSGGSLLVAVGGDGFLHEVFNAAAVHGMAADTLAVVPSGTGNGVATSLGIRTMADAARSMLRGKVGPLDVMRVELAGCAPGSRTTKASALLSVAWGAIADHDALVERELRNYPLKLILVPLWIICKAKTYCGTVTFTPHRRQPPLPAARQHARDSTSGRVTIDGPFNLVQICNLPWIATDVHAAPGAEPADGCLWILIMRGASRLELLRMFLAAESGAHTSHPAVEIYAATHATIDIANADIAIDGELVPPNRDVDVRCDASAGRMVTALPW